MERRGGTHRKSRHFAGMIINRIEESNHEYCHRNPNQSRSLASMTPLPDFTAETTQGTINFHEWIGDGWAILFSHPKDFTPVCTTELGYMAGLQPEFAKRNYKIIGLSVDPVSSHGKWAADIEETQGHKVNYPMIGDPQLKIAKLYGMLPAEAGNTSEGRTAADNATVRTVFVVGSGQEDQADAQLSDEHRPQLRRGAAGPRFDPAHGQAQGVHAGELEAGRRCHHPAGGVGRGGQAEISGGLEVAQAVFAHRPPAEVTEGTTHAATDSHGLTRISLQLFLLKSCDPWEIWKSVAFRLFRRKIYQPLTICAIWLTPPPGSIPFGQYPPPGKCLACFASGAFPGDRRSPRVFYRTAR